MNRIILRFSLVALILLWMGSAEVGGDRRRKKNRNRNNRRRNNDYNDDEDDSILGQFSGDSYAQFMEQYYGGTNGASSSNILSASYIDQDYGESEGSGDDDEDSENFESSGDFRGNIGDNDDEDLLPTWSEPTTISTVTPKRYLIIRK